jgi:hypothetical protein
MTSIPRPTRHRYRALFKLHKHRYDCALKLIQLQDLMNLISNEKADHIVSCISVRYYLHQAENAYIRATENLNKYLEYTVN